MKEEKNSIDEKIYTEKDMNFASLQRDVASIKERITDIMNLMREHDNKYVTKADYAKDNEADNLRIVRAITATELQDKRLEALEDSFLKIKTVIGVIMAVIGFLGIPLIIQIFQFIGGVLGQN